jgi:glutamate racemase
MIDLGVHMIANYINLQKAKTTVTVILGTRITIKSNLHKQKLMDIGFSADEIVNQACWNLSDMIQKGAEDKVTEMIRTYLSEAKEKTKGNPENIVLVLCCTHFQMAKSIIQEIGQDILVL